MKSKLRYALHGVIFALCLLVLPSYAGATKPSLLNNGTNSTATSTSVGYTGITATGGATNYLILVAFFGADPGAFTTVSWDNTGTPQAMTTVYSSACKKEITWAHYTCVWYLANPTAGNKTLQVTWTNSVVYRVEAHEWQDVAGIANGAVHGEASGASGTDAVITGTTSTSNDVTCGAMESDSTSVTLNTAASEVEDLNLANSGGYGASVAHTADGTDNTLTWTITNNRSWGGISWTLTGTASASETFGFRLRLAQ